MHCKSPRISFTTFCRNKTDQWHPHRASLINCYKQPSKVTKFTPPTNIMPNVKKCVFAWNALHAFFLIYWLIFIPTSLSRRTNLFPKALSKHWSNSVWSFYPAKEVRGMLCLVRVIIMMMMMMIFRVTDPGNTGRWLQDIDMIGKPVELIPLFIQYNRKQMTNVKKRPSVHTKRSARFCLKRRNQPHLFIKKLL